MKEILISLISGGLGLFILLLRRVPFIKKENSKIPSLIVQKIHAILCLPYIIGELSYIKLVGGKNILFSSYGGLSETNKKIASFIGLIAQLIFYALVLTLIYYKI